MAAAPTSIVAVAYCQSLVQRPADTIFVRISDLFEGGVEEELLKRTATLAAAGVQVVVLLALSDDGAPGFDHAPAAKLAAMGIPAYSSDWAYASRCTR